MYSPREDSDLLVKEVKKFAYGKVLDMGTGMGIQALAAAAKTEVSEVLAADIDEDSLDYCINSIKNEKITFKKSNLFSKIKGKFDTIIFNPPYLPQDKGIADKALYGGKKGYETLERFFSKAGDHLEKGGIILVIFSSLTNNNEVNEIIKRKGFNFKLLAKQHFFFDDLFVYLIKKK